MALVPRAKPKVLAKTGRFRGNLRGNLRQKSTLAVYATIGLKLVNAIPRPLPVHGRIPTTPKAFKPKAKSGPNLRLSLNPRKRVKRGDAVARVIDPR